MKIKNATVGDDVDPHTKHLFSLPVCNSRRPKLRDQVHGDHDRLARRAARFLTLAAEFADDANTKFWKQVNDTRQRYPRGLTSRQAHCVPFESGANTLPGLEGWLKREGVAR